MMRNYQLSNKSITVKQQLVYFITYKVEIEVCSHMFLPDKIIPTETALR